MAPKKSVKISAEVDLSVNSEQITDLEKRIAAIDKRTEAVAKSHKTAIAAKVPAIEDDTYIALQKLIEERKKLLNELNTIVQQQIKTEQVQSPTSHSIIDLKRQALKIQDQINEELKNQQVDNVKLTAYYRELLSIQQKYPAALTGISSSIQDKVYTLDQPANAPSNAPSDAPYKFAGRNTPVKIASPLNASVSLPNLETQTAKVNTLKARALQFKGDEVEMAAIAFQAIKEEELLSALIGARVSFNRQIEGKANESDDKKIAEVTNKWKRNTELIRKIKQQVKTYLSSKAAGVGDIPKDLEQIYVVRRNKEIAGQREYEEKINTPGGLGTKNPVQTAESTGYDIRHELSPEARGPSDRFALRQSLSGQPEEQPEEVDLDKRIADAEKDAELLSRLEENQKRRNELYEEEARIGRKTHIETANEKQQALNPVGAPGARPAPTGTPEYVPLDEDEKNLQFKMKQSVKDLNDTRDIIKVARQDVLKAQKDVKDLEATLGMAAKKEKPRIKAQLETASQASDKAIKDLDALVKEEKEAFTAYKNLENQYNALVESKKSARAEAERHKMTPEQQAIVDATAEQMAKAETDAREKTERANKAERDRVRAGAPINQEEAIEVAKGKRSAKLNRPRLSQGKIVFDPSVVESSEEVLETIKRLGITYDQAIELIGKETSPELQKQQKLWIAIKKAIDEAAASAAKARVSGEKRQVIAGDENTQRDAALEKQRITNAEKNKKREMDSQRLRVIANDQNKKFDEDREKKRVDEAEKEKKRVVNSQRLQVTANDENKAFDDAKAKRLINNTEKEKKQVMDSQRLRVKANDENKKFDKDKLDRETKTNKKIADDKIKATDKAARETIRIQKNATRAGDRAVKDALKSNELNSSKQGEESFGLAFGGFELRFAGQQIAMATKQMLLPMNQFAQTFGQLNATSSDWLSSQKLLTVSFASLGESLTKEALPTLKLVVSMIDSIAQFLNANPAIAKMAVTAGISMYVIGQTLATVGALMTSTAALKFAIPMGANILGITLPETIETARKIAVAKQTAVIEVVGATRATAILNAGATTAAATLVRGSVVAAATENAGAVTETATEIAGAATEVAVEAGGAAAGAAVSGATLVGAAAVTYGLFKGVSLITLLTPIVKLLPIAAIATAVVGAAGFAWDWLGKNTQTGKEQNMEAAPGQLATVIAKLAGDAVSYVSRTKVGLPFDPAVGNQWAQAVGEMTGAIKKSTDAINDEATAKARANIEMSAVTEYIAYLKASNEAEKKYGEDRKALVADYLKSVLENERKYGEDVAKLDKEAAKIRTNTADEDIDALKQRKSAMEQYALDEKRAYENYYNDRKLATRDYGIDVQRAEEDHQDKMREMQQDHDLKVLDLLYENDAFGLLAEQRSFEKERRLAEEEYAKDTGRKSEDFALKLADEEAAFQLERQRAAEDFALRLQDEDKQKAIEKERKLKEIEDQKAQLKLDHDAEMARMVDDQNEKLSLMDKAYNDEMERLQRDFTDRLRDLNAALLGEAAMYQAYYKDAQINLGKWLESMNGTFKSSLPNWPKQAAGGYLDHGIYEAGESGYEFLLSHQATKEAERAVGGQLTQQNVLYSRRGGGSATVNQNFRFDGSMSASEKAWYRKTARAEAIDGLEMALRS